MSCSRQTADRRSPTLALRHDREDTVSEQNENIEAIADDEDRVEEDLGDAGKSVTAGGFGGGVDD